jgi:hypothetical protein
VPKTGSWCASRAMSFRLGAPGTIATAMDASAMPPVYQRELPGRCRRRSRRSGQSRLADRLAQQHRPGMPGQPVSRSGDPQPVVPRRILPREEHSCPGI